jgi:GDP-4-dehydro-6-deoxy-D-mannose reductase
LTAIGRGNVPDEATPPRRILLTGASGFVGGHLQVALGVAYPDAAVLTDPVDLCDGGAISASVAAARPDVCVHLAAVATQGAARQDEGRAWDVNLHGTLRLANALLRHAPDCHLLFVSSADAYGAGSAGAAINEDTPLAPKNLYAATKAAADLALGAMVGQGLQVTRLRPFNHTGPCQSADLVIPAFARQIASIAAGLQPPRLEVGNLDTWRDFLDVRDVCAAYVACINRRATLASGIILNIGSGQPRRVGDVLAELMSLAGVTAEVCAEASRTRANDVQRAVADSERARALLGWAPVIPWSRTLTDVLDDWSRRLAAEAAP